MADDFLAHFDNHSTSTSSSSSFMFADLIPLTTASIIITLTLLTNLTLIFILLKTKTTREIKNDCYGYYLLNLCVTNILAAVVCIVSSVSYTKHTCDNLSSFLETLCALQILSSSICIETIALMTLERYRVSRNPLLKRKTLSRLKRKIYIIWLWAIVNASPQLFLYKYVGVSAYVHSCQNVPYYYTAAKLYSVFQLFSVFFIPTGVVLFCSIGVLLAYNTETALSLKRRERYRKFVRLVLLLCAIFVVTNFPKQILELVVTSNVRQHDNTTEKCFVVFLLLSWTNYLLVPIIYISMYGGAAITPKCCCNVTASKNEHYSVRSPLVHIAEIEGSLLPNMNLDFFSGNELTEAKRKPQTNGDSRYGRFSSRWRGMTMRESPVTTKQYETVNRLVAPNVEHVINKLKTPATSTPAASPMVSQRSNSLLL